MQVNNSFNTDLDKNSANYVALTPLQFLDRSAHVFPDGLSIIHGELRYRWSETADRCRRLASALNSLGVGRGDTVAIIAPNVPAMYEAHFGVPLSGAVLNTINTRLDSATIAYILEHGEAKVVLVDTEFGEAVEQALEKISRDIIVVDIVDSEYISQADAREKTIGQIDYEGLLASGDDQFAGHPVSDEWDDESASCLPVDAANVPLQWLVLSLDARCGERHQCLSSSR